MSGVGAAVALAALGTLGVALAATGWLQPAPTIRQVVDRLRRQGGSDDSVPPGRGHRMRATVVQSVRSHPRWLPAEAQLRLLDLTVEQHVLRLFAASLAGLVLPPLGLAALQGAGLAPLGFVVPVVVGLAGAVVGPSLVHLATVERAAAALTDVRYQVSAYLDVVTMLLAGNTGYEGALEQAASAGDGRLFVDLRRRIREASARGSSLTEALRRVGVELGVAELEQIAAAASLSAAEGAPVARTLAAKSATLRGALATEQESEARLRTSRLTAPIVGMALIFMGLVIYPALSFS